MKKILALLLAAVFAATLLTACGNKAKTDDAKIATEAVTEKVTEAPVEEATEEATEAPVLPTAAPNEFVYTDPAGKYQVTVPIIWNDTGLILSETDVDGVEFVRFYYKAAYEQGAGHVFSIGYCEDSSKFVDVTQMPHADELLNDGSRQAFVVYPTDVQFAPYGKPGTEEFDKQQAEYGVLNKTKEGIINSFTMLDA